MIDIASLLSGGIIGGFFGALLGGFAKLFWEHWLPGRLTLHFLFSYLIMNESMTWSKISSDAAYRSSAC